MNTVMKYIIPLGQCNILHHALSMAEQESLIGHSISNISTSASILQFISYILE